MSRRSVGDGKMAAGCPRGMRDLMTPVTDWREECTAFSTQWPSLAGGAPPIGGPKSGVGPNRAQARIMDSDVDSFVGGTLEGAMHVSLDACFSSLPKRKKKSEATEAKNDSELQRGEKFARIDCACQGRERVSLCVGSA